MTDMNAWLRDVVEKRRTPVDLFPQAAPAEEPDNTDDPDQPPAA